MEAYTKGLELDPQNPTMLQALGTAKSKMTASRGAGQTASRGAEEGMDFASMMNNPMFSQMAQQLMSNPQMMQT